MLVSSLSMLWSFDPTRVENRIWGDRLGTTVSVFRQFRTVSDGLQKPVIVIIPKYKDRFIERPPMKIVQP
jgi:hypothetical protein